MYYEINEVEVQLNKSEVTLFMTRGQTLKIFSEILIFPSITGFTYKSPKKLHSTLRAKRAKFTF